jgi:MFS transporter, Spinster family, sphingosine-1-phosphate transporter
MDENTNPEAGRTTALPGARGALAMLLIINLVNFIDRYVLSAVVTNVRDEFFSEGEVHTGLMGWLENTLGFDPRNAMIGTLAMAFMVSYMLTAPIFGWLADRMSRWVLIGIGVVLWSLACGASGLAASFGMLFLTRCFVGVGEAAYAPIAPAMISDLYPVKVRGQKIAWFYVAIPVGSALGYIYGGSMAHYLGPDGWRWAFYLVVPPGLLLGVWCFFLKDPPRGLADAGAVKFRPRLRDYLILLRTPSYVLDTLGMTALVFAIGGIAFWMPDYIYFQRPDNTLNQAEVAGIFGLITVIGGLAATLLGGWAGDWLRPRFSGSYFLVSSVAMFIGFPCCLLVVLLPFPWAWAFVFLAVFCLFFNTGPTNTILANVAHPSMRSAGVALNILIIHCFGDAVSPLVIGAVAGARGWDFAMGGVSAVVLIGGVFWAWGTHYLGRDTALAPTRLANVPGGPT